MLTSILVGCGGGSSDGDTSSRKIQGLIRDYTTGTGLSGINISVGTKTAVTGTNGSYTIPVDDNLAARIVVNVNGDGYTAASKIVSVATDNNSSTTLNLDILPIAFTGSFDPSADFTAQVSGSPANVVINASSLVNENGLLPTGNVTAELTPINPALDIDLMPGDMTDNNGDSIASYGAMTAEFSDTAGNALNLASGETATIRIPVSNRGTGSVPPTIPLYYYDETQGAWIAEGTATLSSDETYYEGTVGHFSTWNADYLYESIAITGCVEDESENKVANALVNMEGFNYNSMTSAQTDANGNFTISAMKGGISLVVASTSDKVSNTVKVGMNVSTMADTAIADCLILGEVPLTVRLTWGENPRDLDTHVIGPSNYHIYYNGKGSLSLAPFSQLDVDDVTSYGPEVFTALRFPEAGTYHYAIRHYAGSSTISASPARVELTLEGQTTIFIPPTGQTSSDSWWNVFDIVVDANGSITIRAINTWSSTAPSVAGKFRKLFLPAKVEK